MIKFEFKNRYNVKLMTDFIEENAEKQIKALALFEPYLISKIRIMADAHAGAGCTIGTTMTIENKITPNLVGVDIGCGMLTVKLKEKNLDLKSIDKLIREFVPAGMDVHHKPKIEELENIFDFDKLRCKEFILEKTFERAYRSIGTLGGGNHFIEIAEGKDNELYLVIHSGSRNIGLTVANYYTKLARDPWLAGFNKKEIKEIKKTVDYELAYLDGKNAENYFNDMKIMQRYAVRNRRAIANIILEKCNLTEINNFETIHNYIDFSNDKKILRKGAVSANAGEKLLIPINMRDGSLICEGKGNEDWNCSAPHGAGRLMGRKEAMNKLDLEKFKNEMVDVYSSSVVEATLDEAPDAYKPMAEIIKNIEETVKIIDIIKPVYNFKSI